MNLRHLFSMVMIAALASSCGTKDNDDDKEIVIKQEIVKNDPTGTVQPKDDRKDEVEDQNDTEDSQTDTPDLTERVSPVRNFELEGTYEQVENRQTKIRINGEALVVTNIELPIPTGSGPVRVTPRFPHHLRKLDGKSYFNTLGYYNNGDSAWENVELRVVPHQDGRLLDVSFVLKNVPADNNPSPPSRQQEHTSPQDFCDPWMPCPPDPCGPWMPCPPDPCFPLPPGPCPDPCNPCPPGPPPPPPNPCPNPCPTPDDGKTLLYRFEKLDSPSTN